MNTAVPRARITTAQTGLNLAQLCFALMAPGLCLWVVRFGLWAAHVVAEGARALQPLLKFAASPAALLALLITGSLLWLFASALVSAAERDLEGQP